MPKDVIVGLHTLKYATLDAVLSLNDGSIARASVLKIFRLNPGHNTIKRLKEVEHKQKYHANKAAQQLTNQARQDRRQVGKRKNDFNGDCEAGAY